MYVTNVCKHVILLLVGNRRTAIVLFVGWRVVGLGGYAILTNSEKLILGVGVCPQSSAATCVFLKFVFRYLTQ